MIRVLDQFHEIFISAIILFLTFYQAKDYLFKTGSIISNTDEELIEYLDGAKFIVCKGNNRTWKDSEGDYGKEKCVGYVKKNINKNAEVHFRCEGANQNGEKFWTTRIRQSDSVEGSGRINTYVAGTGKYKKMISIKYLYRVQYHEDAVWYTHKSKLNE